MLNVKSFDINERILLVHQDDFNELGLSYGKSIRFTYDRINFSGRVAVTSSLIPKGSIGIPQYLIKQYEIPENEKGRIEALKTSEVEGIIQKKMMGGILDKDETNLLVRELREGAVMPIQTVAFALSHHFGQTDVSEIEYLTRALADSGTKLDFTAPTYNKHSLGGVPGNKVSLLIVPIVAAGGLLIPKTSTKAITSPSGTVDSMAVFADVDFSPDEVIEITSKTKGCIVFAGGKLDLAPAIDRIIEDAAYPLGIDPQSLMLAGIMSKKLATSTDFMVLDLPCPTTKIPSIEEGQSFARSFVELAARLGVRLEAGLTYGGVPVGHSIGPALEAREALETLMSKGKRGPTSLIEKSTGLAGILFEMAGMAPRGRGQEYARGLLTSGKAYEKFKQIIEAQGGNPDITPQEITTEFIDEDHVFKWQAAADGWPIEFNNSAITAVARAAGAPKDKGAGILVKSKKEPVRKGDVVLEVFASSETALDETIALIAKTVPVTIEGFLMDRIA
ncbi:MAG: thymidine phosphorylase [Promethearchaeota archaeon]